MNADSTTRWLLVGILVCLVALVAQGFGDAGDAAGRYTLTGLRAGSPVLIRTDTVTGDVWKLELRGGGGTWQLFGEPEAASTGGEAGGDETAELDLELTEPGRDDLAASAELQGLDEPPQRRGPKINFASPKPRAPARPAAPSPTTAEDDIESFLGAIGNAALPAEIRVWSVQQVAQSDDPRSTDALIAALDVEDPAVRAAVIEALGTREDPRVAEALAERQ